MGKVAQNSVKYVIEAKLKSTGMVEKPDVVGAIFGQTEGLLGEDLDLRELQERGKVGRIDVQVDDQNGSSDATIKIPSSLDATETALLGAALETIERVGPTDADITVKELRDERTSKRDYIVKRAKQLLDSLEEDKPGKTEITDEIKQEVRTGHISEYKGFEAGPEAEKSDEIILVEGRADVLNLLKHGVKNALALGGTSVPERIQEIGEEKDVTAFLDGDRGGDLILKELKEKADPAFVARAPKNKEVEELGKEDVYSSLRDRSPVKYDKVEDVERETIDTRTKKQLSKRLEELVGTRAVHVLDESFEPQQKLPRDKIGEHDLQDAKAVILDGEIDQDIVESAEGADAEFVVGMKRSGRANSSSLRILTREDVSELKPKNN
jgi:DNA primase